jgi:plastocyanin
MTDTKPQHNDDRAPGPRRPGHDRARGLAALALVAVALTVAACSSSGSASPSTTAKSTTSTAATGGGSSSKATTIVIRNFAFSPSSTTVTPGATVTVDNEDQVAHTITSSKGGFNTGDIPPGQSKTFTAPNTPGRYPYICSIHQYMTGTLTVS